MKLEAEEIGDKEAEESPVDDEEEEETNEESYSLQDKDKRKEKIKQLLQIKKKKSAEEKENESEKTGQNQSSVEEDVYGNQSQIKEMDGKFEENEKNSAEANNEITEIYKEQTKPIERVHTISDDSNIAESDVDELNLLQKLHSGNEINTSTIESTDTTSDISDSLTSSDNKEKNAIDVISIENSSYSESDINKDVDENNEKERLPMDKNTVEEDILPTTVSTEVDDSNKFSDIQVYKYVQQTSNDEYSDPIGNILLASSDEELSDKNDSDPGNEETSMNLQDDALSIGDTVVREIAECLQTERRETTENNINDSAEQLAQVDNNTVSSCGDDVVLVKQGKSHATVDDTIDIFSSFDKNSEESVASVKSVDQVLEEDHETVQKELNQEKTKTNVKNNDFTEIITDSNSLEIVNVRQSNDSNNVVLEDIEMPEAEKNIENNGKDMKNSKLTAVVQSNEAEIETHNAEPVIAEPVGIVQSDVVLKDTTEVEKSEIASNVAASDLELTKVAAKVPNLERTEDTLESLLEEMHSDLNSDTGTITGT